MSRFQEALIREFADSAATRIAARAKVKLRKIKEKLSGDDSGLRNAWEEICVQVQGEESFYWQSYQDVMYDIVRTELALVSELERVALWLQTDDGWRWHCDIEDDEQKDTTGTKSAKALAASDESDSVVERIVGEHVLPMAESYSNRNIERYLIDHSSYELD